MDKPFKMCKRCKIIDKISDKQCLSIILHRLHILNTPLCETEICCVQNAHVFFCFAFIKYVYFVNSFEFSLFPSHNTHTGIDSGEAMH